MNTDSILQSWNTLILTEFFPSNLINESLIHIKDLPKLFDPDPDANAASVEFGR